mmetsp:Transcript_21808/g.65365  ORF Transcript_21808/g.65365 Transcript_21808/m.65365 type:complete len:386 (-) Transcript_21808:65-1222(-)
MGACTSKALPPASVDEIVARAAKKGGVLDLSAAKASADQPAGQLAALGLSLPGKAVPDAVWACSAVTGLTLKGNALGSLGAVGRLARLVSLDVSENSLTELPDLGALTALEGLDCSENHLTALPESIGALAKLKKLSAFKNQFKALPDGLGKCASLEELNVYNNKLTKLPESLAALAGLTDVNVGANKLKKLPNMDAWGHVRELRVHQNSLISQFLPSFAGLKKLALLKIERNLALSELPALGEHPDLEAIECNNCSLETLPAPAALAKALPALQYLTIHQNRLTALPALALPELTTLNAGGNKLGALPSLAGCPKLRVLIVDDCGLTTMDPANTPAALPALERLIVSGNKAQDEAMKALVASFVDTVTKNNGWIRGAEPPAAMP